MEFKVMLIVFAILLFLLTVLSSFGGSIKQREPFFDSSIINQHNMPTPSFPSNPVKDKMSEDMPEDMPQDMPEYIPEHMTEDMPEDMPPLVFPQVDTDMPKNTFIDSPNNINADSLMMNNMNAHKNLRQSFTNIEPYEGSEPEFANF